MKQQKLILCHKGKLCTQQCWTTEMLNTHEVLILKHSAKRIYSPLQTLLHLYKEINCKAKTSLKSYFWQWYWQTEIEYAEPKSNIKDVTLKHHGELLYKPLQTAARPSLLIESLNLWMIFLPSYSTLIATFLSIFVPLDWILVTKFIDSRGKKENTSYTYTHHAQQMDL